jgi:hypothetical protein
MIPLTLLRLIGVAAPSWLTKPIAYLIDALLVVGLLAGVYFAIHHSGEKSGAAKVEAKQAKAHTAAVTAARTDEKAAQATTDQIGTRVAKMDDATTDYLRNQLQELHNEIDAAHAASASAAAVPVDTVRVSASLDAGIARANGAADAADAAP